MILSLALTGTLLVACSFDLRAFRIPNAISFAVVALFLIKAAASGGAIYWPEYLLAFGVALGLGFLAFVLGVMGGGDVKLMTALALWFGMAALPSFLATTAISGGVLALLLMVLRHLSGGHTILVSPEGGKHGPRLLERGAPVPYALPITFAALWLEWV